MPLSTGTRLGPFEVCERLGAGGQGEVYRATDTRLDRSVAIKVLPEHLSSDAESRERFEREARAVSRLNHPHICTLYDVGHDSGMDFLVMEFVEGETLAKRLERGHIGLDDAVTYAGQIAAALDTAHRQGIVHRDLKPGNIMLTASGVKLLDFGLAKLKPVRDVSPLSQMTTADAIEPLTAKGTILGTLQYMAPEQLEGKEADARSDIFAFGTVIYEMITGRRAFEGANQASIIGAILRDDPEPMAQTASSAPPALDHVVRRCLAKDPEARWQTVSDLTRELEWSSTAPAAEAPAHAPRRRFFAYTGVVIGALVLSGTVLWVLPPDTPEATPSPTRFYYALPDGQQFTNQGRPVVALSPDASRLVYVANERLYSKPMEALESSPIPGTEETPLAPFFDPTGAWVGYYSRVDGELKKIPVAGGDPISLTATRPPLGAPRWQPDGTIVFGHVPDGGGGEVVSVSANGGELEVLAGPEAEAFEPWVLPGGQFVVYTSFAASEARGQLVARSLASGEEHILFPGERAYYLASGHLVYARDNEIFGRSFDPETLEFGRAVSLVQNVSRLCCGATPLHYAVSDSGGLIYLPENVVEAEEATPVWVARNGVVEEALSPLPLRAPQHPRLSPAGDRFALSVDLQVWVYYTDGRPPAPITFEGRAVLPLWAPDGESVVVRTLDDENRTPMLQAFRADGSDTTGTAVSIVSSFHPLGWLEDGSWILGSREGRDMSWQILKWPIASPDQFETIVEDRTAGADVSPDGAWLAFTSDRSGSFEIWVQPLSGAGGPERVSPAGGVEPVWSPGGRELYYLEGNRMMAVPVALDPTFSFGTPEPLFESDYLRNAEPPSYDAAADGRFLMLQRYVPRGQWRIAVVQNWIDELMERVPINQ